MGRHLSAARFVALYVKRTLRHKRAVLRAGRQTRARLVDLILHDVSKFGPAELPHYARRFCGPNDRPDAFRLAVQHHKNVNRHHWEWWVPRTELGEAPKSPFPMPERVVREMVADWMAATSAYSGFWPTSVSGWPWINENFTKMNIHPLTAERVDMVLREVFGEGVEAIQSVSATVRVPEPVAVAA